MKKKILSGLDENGKFVLVILDSVSICLHSSKNFPFTLKLSNNISKMFGLI